MVLVASCLATAMLADRPGRVCVDSVRRPTCTAGAAAVIALRVVVEIGHQLCAAAPIACGRDPVAWMAAGGRRHRWGGTVRSVGGPAVAGVRLGAVPKPTPSEEART